MGRHHNKIFAFGDKSKYRCCISIANYIHQDLGARLQSGQELPAPLTISALANHYQVSYTPVRSALLELEEEGLVVKESNGRLSRSRPAERTNGRKARKASLPEPPSNSYEIISNDLMDLSLEGESIYLREEASAEKYGLSRSAVRNIFHRLAGSGLLDHIPRRGWKLRSFRQKDLHAFNEVREVLELKALDLARPHLRENDLERMLEKNRLPQAEKESPELDNSLHAYFIEKAGNFYIKDFFERQGSYFELLFKKEGENREAAIEAAKDHRDVLEALLEKNWRGARKALSRHIKFSHPVLSRI